MIKSSSFDLRPHHSLCIQFFVGKGYSSEFVHIMNEIITILNETNPLIILSQDCDIICRECPNNISGKCTNHEKVSAIDKRCIEEYALNFGDKIYWNDLKNLAYKKIIDKNRLISVCRNCQWCTLCLDANNKYRL